MSAGQRAVQALSAGRDALATRVTELLFAEMPSLHEKYGPIGWEKCVEDMRYNIQHLSSAVELDQPALFADYVRWVDELLRSRGVSTLELRRVLELLGEELRGRLDADAVAAVDGVMAAGLAALSRETE